MNGIYLSNVVLIEQQLKREQERHSRKPDVESDSIRHFLPLDVLRSVLKRPE